MTALVGTLALAALAALVFALAGSLVCLVVGPRLLRKAAERAPQNRARTAFWLAVAPALAGVTATALCFLPSVANLVGIGHDHCLHHDDDHLHFCFVHHPMLRGLVEPLVLALLLLFVAMVLARELRARLRIAALSRQVAHARGTLVDVDSPVPFAVTIGRLRPRILISRALRAALAPEQLEVVIAHESAHGARRDLVWRLLVDVLSLLHWPALRRRVASEHALACEQACDEAAAVAVGDRLLVAETIVAVERLLPKRTEPVAAFADRGVEARVQALLRPPLAVESLRWSPWHIALLAAATLALANPLHHMTETLLGLLTR